MEQTNESVGADEHLEILCVEEATLELEQVLSSGLPVFYRRAYRLLGNRADAEDAVQDALLAAYTHLDQVKVRSQMSSWVTAIVLNRARMRMGAHERKYESCEVLIHSFHGCKGTPPYNARTRKRREDDGRSGHGDRRL